jgi:hypothetical protein
MSKICGDDARWNFPGESWLRRRGKFKDRPGVAYNTLAIRINQWLGGIRTLRRLLGQDHVGSTAWTAELAINAWQAFEAKYGLSPTQLRGRERRKAYSQDVVRRAAVIHQACLTYGVLEQARNGKTARKQIWTKETAVSAWLDFKREHGISPSTCMGRQRRKPVAEEVYKRAVRVYSMTRYLGLLDQVQMK